MLYTFTGSEKKNNKSSYTFIINLLNRENVCKFILDCLFKKSYIILLHYSCTLLSCNFLYV